MTDYSYAVPDTIILDRSPRDLGLASQGWDVAFLRVSCDSNRVEVTSGSIYDHELMTRNEVNEIAFRFTFADSHNTRVKILTERLRTDLGEGGYLSVLIDRLLAGHTTEYNNALGAYRGILTADAKEAYDDLFSTLSKEDDRYIDYEWTGYEDEDEEAESANQ